MIGAFSSLALAAAAINAAAASPKSGVPLSLAQSRAAAISDLSYELRFEIPAETTQPLKGQEILRLRWKGAPAPLVLDFRPPAGSGFEALAGGTPVAAELVNEHVVIPASAVREGANEFMFRFTAGDGPLNRTPDYLYTLLVPARAREIFPCFDQPDLKASFALTLTIPKRWRALANGEERDRREERDASTLRFAPTEPISTYLFAFAAGDFQVEEAMRNGRRLRLFHRETDRDKVAANRDAIFDLMASSLSWMEGYTGIPYAFGKLDAFAVPAFQYSGMEHVGAIWFDASHLFLERSATQKQLLDRAELIAHEVAHMWFGDLVTMRWFSDVWLKEVFANFMAAKSVDPMFPKIDHELRFAIRHLPSAYRVDRTDGANAILQPLDNLNEAGALYGPIIYDKAPVVMKQLENLVGAGKFQAGLREYLQTYRFGNATWDDLVAILSRAAGRDLGPWSRTWVKEPGRPSIGVSTSLRPDSRIGSLRLTQSDPRGRGLLWDQRVVTRLQYGDEARQFEIELDSSSVAVPAEGLGAPDFVLPDASGLGYGLFELDAPSLHRLAGRLPGLREPLARACGWLVLWDAMLEQRLPPEDLISAARAELASEQEELIVQRVLYDLAGAYWRFIPPANRARLAPALEALLWSRLESAPERSLKATFFESYSSLATTPAALSRLERIWSGREKIEGLPLEEEEMTDLAMLLAVKTPAHAGEILRGQLARITNPERRRRFEFIEPALSPDTKVRDAFFTSLQKLENRRHEAWVADALSYLHDPIREGSSEKYIEPSLVLLPELQRTGDIFFVQNWLRPTLGGHGSLSAAKVVRDFLSSHPDLPPRLRAFVLQAADLLFRAAKARSR